jgi:hypothetical protein
MEASLAGSKLTDQNHEKAIRRKVKNSDTGSVSTLERSVFGSRASSQRS